MMGSSPPSQSTLSDLKVLLELLQAASNPAQAKTVIDSIADARKQYDDAIAESNARLVAALNAENQAGVAQSKAAMAGAEAEKKIAELDAKTLDATDAAMELAQDRSHFEVYKSEIAAIAKANVATKAEHDALHRKAMSDVESRQKAVDAQADDVAAKLAEALATKAEYEEKLARIKALTA